MNAPKAGLAISTHAFALSMHPFDISTQAFSRQLLNAVGRQPLKVDFNRY